MGFEKVIVALAYILLSTSLTLITKCLFSNHDFNNVTSLILAQQIFIIFSLVCCKILGLTEKTVKSYTFSSSSFWCIIFFELYVFSSLYALKYVDINVFVALRKTGFAFTAFLDFLYDQKCPSSVEIVYLMIILGGASGVDFLAERWADNNNIPLAVYNEAWSKPRPDFAKDSGRPEAVSSLAKEMLTNATHMLAFPGPDSVWTKKMMEMGVQMNVPIACVELPTSGL